MNMNFLNKDNWREIERGYLYEAVVFYPSDTKRPLSFFIPDENNEHYGSLVKNIGDFSARIIDGKRKAVEQKAVVNLKPRKVLVLSNNDLNKSDEIEYIQAVPIMSISDKDKKKTWYYKMKNDEHPAFVYLSKEITGRECYLDISELMSIHKSMLLNKLMELPPDRLQVVEDNILECLDLGLIEYIEEKQSS